MMSFSETWTWIKENIKLVLGIAGAAVVGLGAIMFSRSKDKTIKALIDNKMASDAAKTTHNEKIVDTLTKFQRVEDEIREEFVKQKRDMNHNQKRNLELKKKQYLEAETEEERAAIVEETELAFDSVRKVPLSSFAKVHNDEE